MDAASLTLPKTNDDALEWLWRSRHSPDGRMADCRKCERPRTHHRVRSRPAWECDSCGAHVHPTAGTLLERTRIPIQTWIRAALLLCAYTDLSVRQLQAELNVTYKTAWRLRRLIRSRLPSGERPPGEITSEAAADVLEKVFVVDHDVDVRDSVGHALRRGTRARVRRSALGTGIATAREPREVIIMRAACAVLSRRGY
ncbi:MAG: transposase, partial [Acidobacteriota bacterium]|nr:transposase [Acidobacteriota bacterium]